MQSANIKVAVRIRPILEDEQRAGHVTTKLQADVPNGVIKYGLFGA
jgi:hypothetical protein